MTMITEPIWRDYAIRDNNGFIAGIDFSAPEDVQRAYEQYNAEQQKYKDEGEPIPK